MERAAAEKLSTVAYGAVLDMILRGAIAAGELGDRAADRGAARHVAHARARGGAPPGGRGHAERQRSGALVVRPYSMETFPHALAVRAARRRGGAAWRAARSLRVQSSPTPRERHRAAAHEGLGDARARATGDFHAAIAAASGNPALATTIGDLQAHRDVPPRPPARARSTRCATSTWRSSRPWPAATAKAARTAMEPPSTASARYLPAAPAAIKDSARRTGRPGERPAWPTARSARSSMSTWTPSTRRSSSATTRRCAARPVAVGGRAARRGGGGELRGAHVRRALGDAVGDRQAACARSWCS